jgi:mannose-6-phosphate isomerase-like protein (cupin superfamily)
MGKRKNQFQNGTHWGVYYLKHPEGETARSTQFNYVTKLDIKYEHLELIDIPAIVSECTDAWFNQTLTKVNDSVVRLGIVESEYHWHLHDADDEFFFVLSGGLLIDLEDRTIELKPNQGVPVPRGCLHRPRAPQKTVMLMVETSAIEPTGNRISGLRDWRATCWSSHEILRTPRI